MGSSDSGKGDQGGGWLYRIAAGAPAATAVTDTLQSAQAADLSDAARAYIMHRARTFFFFAYLRKKVSGAA